MDRELLLERAREAQVRAYAPYSGFHVGAALLDDEGGVHVGCNVESASYGLTVCAERSAVAAAVAAGRRRFVAVAITTNGKSPAAPCGACRQVLAEFAPGLEVISEAGARRAEWTLDRLLPDPFQGMDAAPDG